MFPKSLLLQGQTGGRQAAQSLTKAIAEYLANEDLQVLGRLSFWITVYYDKRSLLDLLLDNDVCATEQFEAFLSGFSETSPRFTMVDVGFSKGAAVSKVTGADFTYVAPSLLSVVPSPAFSNIGGSSRTRSGSSTLPTNATRLPWM